MTAGIDAGCVGVRLGIANGRVSAVEIASERPNVGAVLRGRPADHVVRLVPMLFALCGQAQGRAAALALAAARGASSDMHIDAAIRGEALREHLWRWLLDLPPLLGESPLQKEFVAATGWLAGGRRDDVAALLASAPLAVLRRRLGEIEDVGEHAPRCLPALDARASLASWPHFDAGFCRRPQWQGAAAETGAIARRQGGERLPAAAFAARWLARLDEVHDWAHGSDKVGAGGTASAASMTAGSGRALVETARGLLMHEIVLDGDVIADYFIVAPTEWNFHPQGSLAGWLLGRDATERQALRAFVGSAVAALDPCVRWELEGL